MKRPDAPMRPPRSSAPERENPRVRLSESGTDAASQRRVPRKRPERELSATRQARIDIRRARRERRAAIRQDQRRFTAARRHRRLLVLVGLGAISMLFVGTFGVAYSPLMAVRTVEVTGVSRLDPAVVRAALSNQVGTPLPLVSAESIRTSLSVFPTIQSFSTESIPPSTLVVHVIERTPIGSVKRAGSWDVVDPAGVVMSTTDTAPGGVPRLEVPSLDSPAFGTVASMLLAIPADVRAQASRAGATSAVDAWFETAGGTRVVWGDQSEPALKLRVMLALLASSGTASEINVSAPNSPFTR
ncbi:MAG TPA: FtsQ-type POTRA domain-containing protein [Microbacteriaceae bacterium]|nr:FtsQ-type POTRA domain-containing protein [Microbacteriaceae bacterium]